jgi:hypothetical protein
MTGANPLSTTMIHQVLQWRQTAGQVADTAHPYWSIYGRLVEVYCVVKLGGVSAQVGAAQAMLSQERQALMAELGELTRPSGLLHQELRDLERSVDWRIRELRKIHPSEEQAVRQCFDAIAAAVDGSADGSADGSEARS